MAYLGLWSQQVQFEEGLLIGATTPYWPNISELVHQGGFNVIRRISKKLSGSRITPSMKDFDKFIKESELIDPPLRNVSFRSNMKELPICKRLDGFLYTNELKQRFPQTLQDALSKLTSDHCPVVLETNPFK